MAKKKVSKKTSKKKAPPRQVARRLKVDEEQSEELEVSANAEVVDDGFERRLSDVEELLIDLDKRVSKLEAQEENRTDGQIVLGKRIKALEKTNGISELKALVSDGPDSLLSRISDLEEMLVEADDGPES